MATTLTLSLRASMPVLAAALALSASTLAGPLNPPAGPVTSSFKTLTEVEPRTPINATTCPGDADSTYKITQSGSYYLTGPLLGQANKHGIKVNASGVTIDLNGYQLLGSLTSYSGVTTSGNGRNTITLKNGAVIGWGGAGVALSNASNLVVESVQAHSNGASGLEIGTTAVITRCTADFNDGYGIIAESDTVMTQCTARSNTQSGLRTSSHSTITACVASENGTHGIELGAAGSVLNCTANANGTDGIWVWLNSTARGNTCYANSNAAGTAAGITVNSTDNRVEDNNCTANNRGVSVEAAGNFITRNTCSGNTTNWKVVAGNVCLVVSAAGSAAINGNNGGTPPGSTDPNANFTY